MPKAQAATAVSFDVRIGKAAQDDIGAPAGFSRAGGDYPAALRARSHRASGYGISEEMPFACRKVDDGQPLPARIADSVWRWRLHRRCTKSTTTKPSPSSPYATNAKTTITERPRQRPPTNRPISMNPSYQQQSRDLIDGLKAICASKASATTATNTRSSSRPSSTNCCATSSRRR